MKRNCPIELAMLQKVKAKRGASSKHHDSLSLVKIDHPWLLVLKIWGLSERGSFPTLLTPFSRGIIEVACPRNVRMATIDPFDGTTSSDDHLDVYKVQIYV